jgi:hypothetical protein
VHAPEEARRELPEGLLLCGGALLPGSTKTCGILPKLGEPCGDNGCRDRGATCSTTTGACVKVGLPGDPCTPGGEDCSETYVCDANNQCSAGIALGAPCMMFEQCANANTFCDIPDNATMGVCTAPKPNGASCRSHFNCASDVCDPASNTCMVDVPCD